MAFQNNTPPDIMKPHEVLFPKYVGIGTFVDFGTYMSEAELVVGGRILKGV